MAFRNDFIGGSDRQAGVGLVGGQAVAGIEKTMAVKLAFFAGAVVVFATSVLSMVHYAKHVAFVPAACIDNLFLLAFGLLMMVLDFPIPNPPRALVGVRDSIYKFFLFLTRFAGRGVWYIFLATIVFSTLWDGGLSRLWGAVFTGYLIILGLLSLIYGGYISVRLNRVRAEILRQNRTAEHYLAPNHPRLSKKQFETMVNSVMTDELTGGAMTFFSYDGELDYVINALSFKPHNDGQVTLEEVEYWLSAGSMIMC